MPGEKKRTLEDIFLREKPAKILLGIKTAQGGVYATVLSKEANCTFAHTTRILDFFRKLGIVKFEKTGRIKKITLTDDGWDLAHNMEAMLKKLAQIGEKEPVEKEKKKAAKKE